MVRTLPHLSYLKGCEFTTLKSHNEGSLRRYLLQLGIHHSQLYETIIQRLIARRSYCGGEVKCVHVIRQSMYYHTASEKLGSESENASAVLFSPFQTVSKSFLHEISTAKKKNASNQS